MNQEQELDRKQRIIDALQRELRDERAARAELLAGLEELELERQRQFNIWKKGAIK